MIILGMIAEGKLKTEIASLLGIQRPTLLTYLANIRSKVFAGEAPCPEAGAAWVKMANFYRVLKAKERHAGAGARVVHLSLGGRTNG